VKRVVSLCVLLLGVGVFASAAPGKPRPEIMGIALGMSRDGAQARLKSLGNLEKEDRKRQEVWAIKDPRVSHLLVGYDTDYHVRYVTAIARTDGIRIRYQEVADLKHAQQVHSQGIHKFTWEVPERRGQFAYTMTARGRDANYLDSYSVKKLGEEEID
jgi:glycerophosphoryl diester phosphodiesterase